jgi:hypothetical protein
VPCSQPLQRQRRRTEPASSVRGLVKYAHVRVRVSIVVHAYAAGEASELLCCEVSVTRACEREGEVETSRGVMVCKNGLTSAELQCSCDSFADGKKYVNCRL